MGSQQSLSVCVFICCGLSHVDDVSFGPYVLPCRGALLIRTKFRVQRTRLQALQLPGLESHGGVKYSAHGPTNISKALFFQALKSLKSDFTVY